MVVRSWEICCRDGGHGGKEGDPPERMVEMAAVVIELGDPHERMAKTAAVVVRGNQEIYLIGQ